MPAILLVEICQAEIYQLDLLVLNPEIVRLHIPMKVANPMHIFQCLYHLHGDLRKRKLLLYLLRVKILLQRVLNVLCLDVGELTEVALPEDFRDAGQALSLELFVMKMILVDTIF
jgi:hypothetical protein